MLTAKMILDRLNAAIEQRNMIVAQMGPKVMEGKHSPEESATLNLLGTEITALTILLQLYAGPDGDQAVPLEDPEPPVDPGRAPNLKLVGATDEDGFDLVEGEEESFGLEPKANASERDVKYEMLAGLREGDYFCFAEDFAIMETPYTNVEPTRVLIRKSTCVVCIYNETTPEEVGTAYPLKDLKAMTPVYRVDPVWFPQSSCMLPTDTKRTGVTCFVPEEEE